METETEVYSPHPGVMATQWCTLDGKKYYFDPDTAEL